MSAPGSITGTSARRIEDGPLIRGAGRYLDDLPDDGVLHLEFVRSPYAHAEILEFEWDDARSASGVELVLLPSDVPNLMVPPMADPDKRIPDRPALAQGKVRTVGQPVAVVAAASRVAARDAADLLFVDYEPLDVLGDPAAAVRATPLYAEFPDNLAFDKTRGDREAIDALDGMALEGTVEHPRVVPAPMENRGILAEWDGPDRVTVTFGTQAPVLMADEIAAVFGVPRENVRVVVPDMGGAFGCKFDLAEEEVVTIEVARRTGRPAKWLESRREHFLTIGHGRAQTHHYKVVVDDDAMLLGLWIDSLVDLGVGHRYLVGAPFTPRMGTGPYQVGLYGWRQRGVFTNRASRGIYRGAGRPEATLTIERIIDHVASATGVDPAEVRRRNFIVEFPFVNPAGLTYDSGDYHAALEKLLDMADYEALRARQAELLSQGRYMGIGLCAYVEATGFEKYEKAVVRVDADGVVEALVGTQDHGQGHHTTFAQLIGDQLGLQLDQIRLRQGDTDEVPFGFGTSGSRSGAHGGSSVAGAAKKVAEKAARIAAHLLEADPGDIVFADGKAGVRGSPGVGLAWEDVAAAAHDPDRLPPGEEPGLTADHKFDSGGLNYPFGMHLAVVEVDTDTGAVSLERIWAVDDCGTVLNPMIAEGQRHGGMAQGIGQAMFEEAVYDEDGNLLTASFMDYLLPAAAQLPHFDLGFTVTPSPHNPLGVKGVAETGAIGTPPAIANAVVDALRPLGVSHIDIPLKPERVWRAIHG